MNGQLITLMVLLTVVFLGYGLIRRYQRVRWESKENLPEELRGAKLWASEKSFQCRRPVPLIGRVDQVYRVKKNHLITVDTKHRNKVVVYESDRLQLSQYAVLIKRRPWGWMSGMKVEQHGYLRLVTHEGVHYRRVELMPENEVVSAYHRYLDILSGRERPDFAENKRLCYRCEQREKCPRIQENPQQVARTG